MIWVLSAISALIASELFLRLPIMRQLAEVGSTAKKSMHLLGAKAISDHWKEKVLPTYALKIGKAAVIFFALLCVALSPVVLAGFLYPTGMTAWLGDILAPLVLVFLFVVSVGYMVLRSRLSGA